MASSRASIADYNSAMRRFAPLFGCLLLAQTSFAQRPLNEIFDAGYMLEDRNSDGVIDFVNAELVLGDAPSPFVIAAASDIAARLGFETMAMNLPLTAQQQGVGIAVGVEAASALGIDLDGIRVGEGLITTAVVEGREWLIVTGSEDSGTRAAATALSGRLPHLWDPDGATFTDVIADIRAALVEEVIEPQDLRITRVIVGDGELRELSRVDCSGARAVACGRRETRPPA